MADTLQMHKHYSILHIQGVYINTHKCTEPNTHSSSRGC